MNETRRRWLIISTLFISILFISAIIYGIFLYVDLNNERTKGHDETIKELKKQTAITEVKKIENFNGEKAYHVVFGENEEGKEQIIFYPLEGQVKHLKVVDVAEILPEQAMLQMWQSECRACQFVKITPALMDDEVLWEIVYYDEENRYVFDYRSIYDGSPYEEIGYLRQFN